MKTYMIEIEEHLRHGLIITILKQWKRPKTRYNTLIKLRIDEKQAYKVANTSKGYYSVTSSLILHIAISNKSLKKGLMFPLDHYIKAHTLM